MVILTHRYNPGDAKMDEILKKLLESDLLSAEVKAELTEQFNGAVATMLAEERSKLEVEIRTQLTEEFVAAREELAETINVKLDEIIAAEVGELKDDIAQFRDLEVETAEKIVEEKERLAQVFAEQLDQLTDRIDTYLDQQLAEEIAELKEDIDLVKKLELGREIFEAYEATFKKFRKADLETVEQDLAETRDRLADAEKKLSDAEDARLSEARSSKMDELLKPLSGNTRETMKLMLSNVPTEKLDEGYKTYIARVMKESADPKDKAPITEGIKTSTVITGNEEVPEEVVPTKATDSLSRMRMLAGVPSK
jgi:hypothetical protein